MYYLLFWYKVFQNIIILENKEGCTQIPEESQLLGGNTKDDLPALKDSLVLMLEVQSEMIWEEKVTKPPAVVSVLEAVEQCCAGAMTLEEEMEFMERELCVQLVISSEEKVAVPPAILLFGLWINVYIICNQLWILSYYINTAKKLVRNKE